MANGGLAGWLISSEFMDVNYGAAVKQYLLNTADLLHIHRFDPNDAQFNDALVSSAVVWFRKASLSSSHEVRFTYGGSLTCPKIERFIAATALRRERKWTRCPQANIGAITDAPVLSDYFTIKRGLATGDNSYIILNNSLSTAAKLYLMLYPKPLFAKAVAKRPALMRQVWEYLNAIRPADLLGEDGFTVAVSTRLSPRNWSTSRSRVLRDFQDSSRRATRGSRPNWMIGRIRCNILVVSMPIERRGSNAGKA